MPDTTPATQREKGQRLRESEAGLEAELGVLEVVTEDVADGNEGGSSNDVRRWLDACPVALPEAMKAGIEAMVRTADAKS